MSELAAVPSIAIVGMAGRFPGAAGIDAFWDDLVEGREGIRTFTRDELRDAGVPDEMADDPAYVPAAGIPDDVAGFDLSLFRVAAGEAAVIDPQHRLFLECAWEALEDSGTMTPDDERRTGVFASTDFNTYLPFVIAPGLGSVGPAQAFQIEIGNDKDYLATRLSYKLDLQGPSVVVQTACSSSLVAVHMACESLLARACDTAVAGGSRVHVPLTEGHLYEEGGVAAAEPHCRAFDRDATGTLRGSGAAVVVLKRAEDAVQDRDRVYALIVGSAVNNDGAAKVGFTAPSVAGQRAVISEALAVAGVAPGEVSYVETHGTGTKLGDPIEVAALTEALRARDRGRRPCVLGAVKPSIGHMGSAAGVAGLVKAALAFDRGAIPGTLHFTEPNPELRLEGTSLVLTSQTRPWPRDPGRPRFAGVSSFGIGGTNAHVVLGEAPDVEERSEESDDAALLVLSAATTSALGTVAGNLAGALASNTHRIEDVAYTLQVGRRALEHRWTVVAETTGDAIEQLRALADRAGVDLSALDEHRTGPGLCFLFPGQGAEYAGMAHHARARYPSFAEDLERCADLLARERGIDLYGFLDTGHVPDGITRTAVVQPSLFALEYCLARLWMSWGLRPTALVGHSVGEYVAAAIAEVFSMEDGLRLTAARGEAMGAMPSGAMLAVRASEDQMLPLLEPGCSISATNSPKATVVAGPVGRIDAFVRRLEGLERFRFVRLDVEHAFHTPAVDRVLAPFRASLEMFEFQPPRLPIYSNLTGHVLAAEDATSPGYWGRQTAGPVQFMKCIRSVAAEGRCFYLEVGPGQALGRFAQQALGPEEAIAGFALGREDSSESRSELAALGAWWRVGGSVAWDRRGRAGACKVRLPTYPFERQRCWFDRQDGPAGPATPAVPTVPADSTAALAAERPAAVAEPLTGARRTDEVRQLVAEILGHEPALVAPDVSLVEQGMESLALLELAESVRRRFGIRVALAQLLSELSTVERLAAHVGGGASASAVEAPPAPVPVTSGEPRPAERMTVSPFTAAPNDGTPTPDQTAFLDQFMPAYVRRTARSKACNDRYRRPHADPRTTAGFRPTLKEITYPIVSDRALGASMWDLDDNRYVDLTMGFGVNLFGHAPAFVVDAVRRQLERTMSVGPQSALAGDLAERLNRLTGFERAAFTNSGTEAVMTAVRLARAATRRDRIVLFRGSYHGTFDGVLARPQLATPFAVPLALGVPRSMVEDVVVLDYDVDESLSFLSEHGSTVAAVLVEPVQSRSPGLQPVEFLGRLREITRRSGTLLVVDEMITGFRADAGGVNTLWGLDADMATFGKVIGGGLPIGVVAGRAAILDLLDGGHWSYGDASRPVADQTLFAGTFCKHPLAMAAAGAVLSELERRGPALQRSLTSRTSDLVATMNDRFASLDCPISVPAFSSLFAFDVRADALATELFFKGLVHRGVYVWEGRTSFLSTAHSDADVQAVVDVADDCARELIAAEVLPGRRRRPAAAGVGRGPGSAAFPVRDEQMLLWLGTEIDPKAVSAYNEVLTIPIPSGASDDVVATAVQDMCARHDALRLRFDTTHWSQRVVDDAAERTEAMALGSGQAAAEAVTRLRAAPFDVARGPVVRTAVLDLASGQRALVLVAPHVVVDGWSFDVLRRELLSTCEHLIAGRSRQPVEAATRFEDFVRWELDGIASYGAESDAYWRQVLAGVGEAGALFGNGDGQAVGRYDARVLVRSFRDDLAPRLRSLSSSLSVTPFSVTLAAWFATLAHETGRRDVTVAVTFAGQPMLPAADLVGYCVKVLPIRVAVTDEDAFTELAGSAHTRIAEARDHWFVRESDIIQRFWPDRGRHEAPLGGVSFQMETRQHAVGGGLGADIDLVGRPHTKFDLSLVVTDLGTRLVAELVYAPSAVPDETAESVIDTYVRVLETACAAPSSVVRRLAGRATDLTTVRRRPVSFVQDIGVE